MKEIVIATGNKGKINDFKHTCIKTFILRGVKK